MAHTLKVVRSINAPGGLVCVDIVVDEAGRYGFACYRRDPEDGRGWFAAGLRRAPFATTPEAALDAARADVPWLRAS